MRPCVVLLGGSFDPVHNAHVSLGAHFAALLRATQLRVIPVGRQWQKNSLRATPEQRAEMARLAFAGLAVPVLIDTREIERGANGQPSYTIDTLRQLRAELGPEASLVFVIGADQLQRLDTWHDWRQLFDYAHVCVATRSGFALAEAGLPAAVASEFSARLNSIEQIRNTPHGLTYLAQDFAVDISATQIRAALQRGDKANSLIAPLVLDYIEQHNLYKS